MGFTIPNEPIGANARQSAQAEPHQADIDAITRGLDLTGVLSGGAVTAQGSPNMTVAVAEAVIVIKGKGSTIRAGNVTITAAGANPRYDLVVAHPDGTLSAIAGTTGTNPQKPDLPDTRALLAEVYVAASASSITSVDIIDKRLMLRQLETRDIGAVDDHEEYFGITTGAPSGLGTLADWKQDMLDIAELGGRWIRMDAAFGTIALAGPTESGWVWNYFDDRIKLACDAGLKVLLNCGYSPQWLLPDTQLNGAYTAGTATMTVDSTNAAAELFPDKGTLDVVGITGQVTYTGKTATTFTGCSGGSGTGADNAGVSFGNDKFGPDTQARWDALATFVAAVVNRYKPGNNAVPGFNQLNGAYAAGAGTMTLDAVPSDWPTAGSVFVTGMLGFVSYTGKTGTTLTGCSGGAGTGADNARVTYGLEKVGVQHFGIWNEPNIESFWRPAPTLPGGTHDYVNVKAIRDYTNLLKTCYPAAKAAFPDAIIVAPDIAGFGQYDIDNATGINPVNYIEGMYANGARGYFDALSCHPYITPNQPPHHASGDVWSSWMEMYEKPTPAGSLRGLMHEHGDGAKKIWVTEFGYIVAVPFGDTPGALEVSEPDQAGRLTLSYDLWKNYPWAGPMFWYNHRDFGAEPYFGLMELTTRRKRAAFFAYQDAVKGPYGPKEREKIAGDQTNATTSLVDITGLLLPMLASTDYFFEFWIPYTANATTTGLGLSVNGPAGVVYVSGTADIPIGADGTGTGLGTYHGHITAYDDTVLSTATPAATPTVHFAQMRGIVRNGTTPGDLKARFRSEVAVANAIVVKQGAWGRLTRI